jgi:hypothetical protein
MVEISSALVKSLGESDIQMATTCIEELQAQLKKCDCAEGCCRAFREPQNFYEVIEKLVHM